MTAPASAPSRAAACAELCRLFLRLGTTAFGGPAAHIALMEDEVVRRRRWLTSEEFLDLLGATNLIPGPNSTEMAIHIGYRRAGWAGLLVAGGSFIVPAVLLTTLLAWVYQRYGALPRVEPVLAGVKAVIIAVVAQALVGLARSALRTPAAAVVAVLATVATALGANELGVLLAAGLALAAVRRGRKPGAASFFGLAAGTAAATPFGLLPLFLTFAKIGSVLFGSGYVLLAFLRAELVERNHWLTEAQLLDAVAAGQITPGPLFTTATFVGYLLAGGTGALVATLGIFAPAFVFVDVSGPLVPWLRRSPAAGAFLDGVNAASLALMAVVTWQLAGAAITGVPTAALALVSALLLARYRVNSLWLVLGGAIAGWLMH
jgi:chromate transporter